VSDRSKGAGGLGGGQRARAGASAPVKAASPAARPAAPPFEGAGRARREGSHLLPLSTTLSHRRRLGLLGGRYSR